MYVAWPAAARRSPELRDVKKLSGVRLPNRSLLKSVASVVHAISKTRCGGTCTTKDATGNRSLMVFRQGVTLSMGDLSELWCRICSAEVVPSGSRRQVNASRQFPGALALRTPPDRPCRAGQRWRVDHSRRSFLKIVRTWMPSRLAARVRLSCSARKAAWTSKRSHSPIA
jgi:hypothetical protein